MSTESNVRVTASTLALVKSKIFSLDVEGNVGYTKWGHLGCPCHVLTDDG
jgi:hypothetical protein